MKHNQNGFAVVIAVFVVAAAVLAGAGVWVWQAQIIKPKPAPVIQETESQPNQLEENEKEAETIETVVSSTEAIDTLDWKTYRSEEWGFEIDYPSKINVKNWAEETPNMLLLLSFGNNANISDAGVVINIEKDSSIKDLDTVVGRENLFNNLAVGPNDISDYKIGKYNYPAKKIDYNNKNLNLGFIEYLMEKNGFLFQIHYYRSNKKNDISENEFNRMLSTFKFIEKTAGGDLSEAQILEQLKNADHLCYGFWGGNKVKFTDGIYEEKIAGSAIKPYCKIDEDFVVYGDFNGDNLKEAVLVIASNGGGSGTFIEMEVFINENGRMVFADKAMIDDRARINSLKIEKGAIVLDFIGHGQGEPMCCPATAMIWRWKFENGKLVNIN